MQIWLIILLSWLGTGLISFIIICIQEKVTIGYVEFEIRELFWYPLVVILFGFISFIFVIIELLSDLFKKDFFKKKIRF